MDRFPPRPLRTRLPFLSFAALLALAPGGCIPYTTAYVADPSTRKVFVRVDRKGASAGPVRLSVLSSPSATSPGAPLSVRLHRTVTGPETRVTSVTMKSYRHAWSPLLVPVGAAVTLFYPVVLATTALSGEEGGTAAGAEAPARAPCERTPLEEGLWRLAGIETSCRVADARAVEVSEPAGRSGSEEEGIAGASLEALLAVPGGETAARTLSTDGSGTASPDLSALFREFADAPPRAELTVRLLPSGSPSVTVPFDGETARRLYLRAREEEAGFPSPPPGRGEGGRGAAPGGP
jgi:hypothetical protein